MAILKKAASVRHSMGRFSRRLEDKILTDLRQIVCDELNELDGFI